MSVSYFFFLLNTFVIVCIEISQNTFLILHTLKINKKYANFMEYNLDKSNKNRNLYDDYLYNIIKGKYLCKEEVTLLESSVTKMSKFTNPERIKEDFANHSEKWRNIYIYIYI